MEAKALISHGSHVAYLDWIRVFGCAAVVLLHVMQGLMSNYAVAEVGVSRAIIWTALQLALSRWAVPCFLMVTGSLLLAPSRPFGWGRAKRYTLRMVVVLATFGLAFCLMESWVGLRSEGWGTVVSDAVLNLLQGRSWSHMWYIYELVGVYLLMPVLWVWWSQAPIDDKRILLGILFVFSCCVTSANSLMGLSLQTFVWLPSSVFYVLLGRYAHECLELDRRFALAGTAACLLNVALAVASVVSGVWADLTASPANPLGALWALTVFLLFKRLGASELPAWAKFTSRLSFGVYLLHPLFLNVFQKALGWVPWGGLWKGLPAGLYELVLFSGAFIGSLLLTAVLKKFPLFRKVL